MIKIRRNDKRFISQRGVDSGIVFVRITRMNTFARKFTTRSFTLTLAGLFATLAWAACAAPGAPPAKKILVFTKSSGFQHDVIKRTNENLSFAEKILKQMGETNNLDFTFTKDGTLITADNIAKYDAFLFYTTGNLTTTGTDRNPPMTDEGKAAFLAAIQQGKGFIGVHSATDTFHSPGNVVLSEASINNGSTRLDPYIQMIGGEFVMHGDQQKAPQICADHKFPGLAAMPADFGPMEEWYTFKNYAADLHVILAQDTTNMKKVGNNHWYDRPNFPSTWAHLYGKGHVFYTSMGHREDVWTNPVFQQVLLGGINWAVGNVEADVTPNLKEVSPEAYKPAPPAPPR